MILFDKVVDRHLSVSENLLENLDPYFSEFIFDDELTYLGKSLVKFIRTENGIDLLFISQGSDQALNYLNSFLEAIGLQYQIKRIEKVWYLIVLNQS